MMVRVFRQKIITVMMVPGLLSPALVSSQTSTPERLTNVINSYPHPSPDGRRVVFQSNRTGTPQIYLMDSDGGNLRQLTDEPLGAETPKWSPDGLTILFASYVGDADNDVFVMNTDGSERRQLTDSPGYDGHPNWSADGTRIIFNSDRTSPDLSVGWNQRRHEIFSMKADGTDLRQHTRAQSICTYPAFSPDGKQIVYRRITDSSGFAWDLTMGAHNSEVFVADLDGANEINLSMNAAFDGWPAWSPDGERIVFASNRAGPANVGQLYVISADGMGLQRITDGPWSHVQPAWSADGRAIYAYQNQETRTYEFGDVVVIQLAE